MIINKNVIKYTKHGFVTIKSSICYHIISLVLRIFYVWIGIFTYKPIKLKTSLKAATVQEICYQKHKNMETEIIQDDANQHLDCENEKGPELKRLALKRTAMVYWEKFKGYDHRNLLRQLRAVEHFKPNIKGIKH